MGRRKPEKVRVTVEVEVVVDAASASMAERLAETRVTNALRRGDEAYTIDVVSMSSEVVNDG